ncbi:9133_t:CDS:1, partial [Gigaspora margarita]
KIKSSSGIGILVQVVTNSDKLTEKSKRKKGIYDLSSTGTSMEEDY